MENNDKFIRDTPFGKLMESDTIHPCRKCKFFKIDRCEEITEEICFDTFYYYFAKEEIEDKSMENKKTQTIEKGCPFDENVHDTADSFLMMGVDFSKGESMSGSSFIDLEEVNKRSQEKFKETLKDFNTLIEKFKDGKERYRTSPLVHQTITALLHNQDPILIIDQLISSQEELQKKLQEMIQSQPSSVLLKEYVLRETFKAGVRRGYDQRSIMAGAEGLGEVDEDTYIQQLKSKSKL